MNERSATAQDAGEDVVIEGGRNIRHVGTAARPRPRERIRCRSAPPPPVVSFKLIMTIFAKFKIATI